MGAVHIIPGIDDPTCGIAVAAKQLIARGIGDDGEVWVHSMWSPMVIKASIKAVLTGKKLVRMPHGCTDPEKLRFHWHKKFWVAPIERWLFRRADRIIATCDEELAWIKAFEPKVKKIEIVSLSIQPVCRVPSNTPRADNESSITTKLQLLYVGRLHPLKGVEYLLEAMPTDCKLVVIGKDEGEGQKLKKIATRRGLDVEFKGVVNETDKEAAYQWCDVLVLPTLSENFGLVIAEALERGKRVITTDGAPAWGEGLSRVEHVDRVDVSRKERKERKDDSRADRVEGGVWSGYGGRLVYLKGYRDGTPQERVRLLKCAIASLVSGLTSK